MQLAAIPTPEEEAEQAALGHLRKVGAADPTMSRLVEFRDEAPEALVGEPMSVEQFEPGQRVKVSAKAIGKGFQGTIKRHNFGRGPVSHGSHNVRAPGSIGASADPARVFKGIKMPGRMGGKRVTQKASRSSRSTPSATCCCSAAPSPVPKGGTVEVRTDG